MAIKHRFTNPKADGADATITRPGNWNDTHAVDPISLTEDLLWTSAKYPARLVATANTTLSGNQTIDGGTTSSGDVVLCTAQTTGSQNGPWIARAGAWVRPTWFPTATAFSLVEKEQHAFTVWDGTAYAGTVWRSSLSAGTTYTIDTDALTYTQITFGGVYLALGSRIKGDYVNATRANRPMFQNSTTNANTVIGALPSGTAAASRLETYNSSDPANASIAQFGINSGAAAMSTLATGTGVVFDIFLQPNSLTAMVLQAADQKIQITKGVASYNGIATVGQGMAVQPQRYRSTANAAALTNVTLIASAPADGFYRATLVAGITQAATTSCALGGTNGFTVTATDPTDSLAKTSKTGLGAAISAVNSTATTVNNAVSVYAKAGTAITFSYDYTSVGATPMQYVCNVMLEFLGPAA